MTGITCGVARECEVSTKKPFVLAKRAVMAGSKELCDRRSSGLLLSTSGAWHVDDL